MAATYHRFEFVHVNAITFGSSKSRSSSSSIKMVKRKCPVIFEKLCDHAGTTLLSENAAQIDYFIKHTILIKETPVTHLLASPSWFKPHPKSSDFGKPLTVWYNDLFEPGGLHSYLPVQFLTNRTVSLVDRLDGESVLFVCPCIE